MLPVLAHRGDGHLRRLHSGVEGRHSVRHIQSKRLGTDVCSGKQTVVHCQEKNLFLSQFLMVLHQESFFFLLNIKSSFLPDYDINVVLEVVMVFEKKHFYKRHTYKLMKRFWFCIVLLVESSKNTRQSPNFINSRRLIWRHKLLSLKRNENPLPMLSLQLLQHVINQAKSIFIIATFKFSKGL